MFGASDLFFSVLKGFTDLPCLMRIETAYMDGHCCWVLKDWFLVLRDHPCSQGHAFAASRTIGGQTGGQSWQIG